MARDELLHELQLLRTARSADDVHARFDAIHAALADITRKRSRFLEDALGAVLRHVSRFASPRSASDDDSDGDESSSSTCDSQRALSSLRAVELCLAFAAPLLPCAELRQRFEPHPAETDSDDLTRERAVCVAFLLHVLGDGALSVTSRDAAVVALRFRIVELLVTCGVALETIFSTSRFREELRECRRMLLPSCGSLSDDDAGFESDGDGDDGDEDLDGDANVALCMTAAAWGVSAFAYFVSESGLEYAFASWSLDGICALAFVLLVEVHEVREGESSNSGGGGDCGGVTALSALIAPRSWLFLLAPSIMRLLQSESNPQERMCGVQLLAKTLQLVPDATIPYHASTDSNSVSFTAKCAAFAQRDWLTPLIQLVTNVMVASPEPSDRALALASLRSLVAKVAVHDRFHLLQDLILKCPYANVSAVLVDEVRANVVRAWSSLAEDTASPFTTGALGALLCDVLRQASERDLVLQADLIASCSSLLRFLHIRDTANSTGIRSDAPEGVTAVLHRIQRRLRVRMAEVTPVCNHDRSTPSQHAQYQATDEFNRLQILEAVLASTIADAH